MNYQGFACKLFFLVFLGISLWGCAEYQPPFTHHLTPDMNFPTVEEVAREKGYHSYYEVAAYKGYYLLCFENQDDRPEVYLVVNQQRQPVLRSMGYRQIDKDKLIHFVDDLIRHQKG